MIRTQDRARVALDMLKGAQLTPFDLLSWTFLLNLEVETRSGKCLDKKVRKTTRKEIAHSLWRKAKDRGTEAIETLMKMGVDPDG